MGPRGEVAKELALYLASGDGDTPQERAARSGALCTAVSRLLQELMDDQPGWDSRYTWLDGIAPLSIRRIPVDALRLVGGAYVVNGDTWTLRAVEAELARPPARSALHFGSPETEVQDAPGREDRLVISPEPSTWPHVFEVELPA